MPHTPEDRQRAITRLRRIRGQAEALERAVEAGSDAMTENNDEVVISG